MTSLKIRALAWGLVLLGWASPTVHSLQESPPVVAQEPIGKNACGPCAVVNALLRSGPSFRGALDRIPGGEPGEKARALATLFGKKPSDAYGKGKFAYDAARGMAPSDLTACFNELLGDPAGPSLEGSFLDRRADESLEAHLRRIHGLISASLMGGMPVLVSVRSFAPKWNEQKKDFQWTGLLGHYVVITEVPESLRPGEKGFAFSFADSYTGKTETGYAAFDEARDFTAAKGDEKTWTWVTDRPFLLVTAPSLRLATQDQPWYLRTTVILSYAIFKPK